MQPPPLSRECSCLRIAQKYARHVVKLRVGMQKEDERHLVQLVAAYLLPLSQGPWPQVPINWEESYSFVNTRENEQLFEK